MHLSLELYGSLLIPTNLSQASSGYRSRTNLHAALVVAELSQPKRNDNDNHAPDNEGDDQKRIILSKEAFIVCIRRVIAVSDKVVVKQRCLIVARHDAT